MVDVAAFLASPAVIGRYIEDPASFVRNGGSVGLASVAPEDESWVTFAKAMVPFMAPVAQGVALAVAAFPRRPRRVLDIAAGHGMFGITIARQSPDARLVALDWPNVLAVARENAAKAGIGERFDTIAGSAFDVDWGRDYDVALLPNFLHHFDRPTNESLLRRAREALAPGGRVLVVEMVPNDDRVKPAVPRNFRVHDARRHAARRCIHVDGIRGDGTRRRLYEHVLAAVAAVAADADRPFLNRPASTLKRSTYTLRMVASR